MLSSARDELIRLLALRRDVRRFRTEPLPLGAVERLVEAACLGPSVGLSEPWRFVRVRCLRRRAAVAAEFERCNDDEARRRDAAAAASAVTGDAAQSGAGEQPGVVAAGKPSKAAGRPDDAADELMDAAAEAAAYRRLKLAGLREAPEQLAVLVDPTVDQGRGLGRATMPETLEYSVVAAIQNLWLMARAEGIGVGWVSIVRPPEVVRILELPSHWKLIAYLCLGYPQAAEEDTPELERAGWERRRDPGERLIER